MRTSFSATDIGQVRYLVACGCCHADDVRSVTITEQDDVDSVVFDFDAFGNISGWGIGIVDPWRI
jgi:hypothetical protein